MRIIRNRNKKSNKKFPWRIILDNNRNVPIPSQYDFKNDFIKKHGCSLVGFYVALRYKGIKKNMQQCLKYARKNLKCRTKYPLKEICKGINRICSGNPAIYCKSLSDKQLESYLKKGYMILFEEGSPIHTVVLLRNNATGKVYRFSDGQKSIITAEKENKRKCSNKNYEGIVVVK